MLWFHHAGGIVKLKDVTWLPKATEMEVAWDAMLGLLSQMPKPPKCPSTDGRTNKMWYNHTGEYNAARKQNEVWMHAITRTNLETIVK